VYILYINVTILVYTNVEPVYIPWPLVYNI
jgi:hypothetical protein